MKKIAGKKAIETLHAPRSGRKVSDTVRAFKKSVSDAGKSFHEGTERVADAVVDPRKLAKGVKAGKIKEETIRTFKNVAADVKGNLKGVGFGDIMCGASYGLGKLSRKIKNCCLKVVRAG